MALQRTKKQVEDDVARARKAAQDRITAPAAVLGAGGVDVPIKKLQRLYAKDTLPRWGKGKDGRKQWLQPKYHAYGADESEYQERVEMGYEPVLKPDQSIVRYGRRSILMKCPQALYNRQLDETAARSKARMQAPRKGKDGSLGKDDKGNKVVPDKAMESAVSESLEEVPVT